MRLLPVACTLLLGLSGCVEPAPRTITGRVLIAETGEPAARASLVIQKVHMPLPLSLPRITDAVSGTTAADGTFSLTLPAYQHLLLKVVGEQCQWSETRLRMDLLDLDEPLEIVAFPQTCRDRAAYSTAEECLKLDSTVMRGLSDAAMWDLRKVAGMAVSLEPLCVSNYVSTDVRTKPVAAGQGVSIRYEATCRYSMPEWSCADAGGRREIAIDGSSPVRVTGDVETAEVLNVLAFLTNQAAKGGLELPACGSPEHRIAFTPDDLKSVTHIYTWDWDEPRRVGAKLDGSLRIWFGPAVPTPNPDVSMLCWSMVIAD